MTIVEGRRPSFPDGRKPIAAEGRKPSPDERRAAILDIAREAFLLDGYSGTSMSRIAAEVGGSKATLYSYFPSKKELFIAVTDRETAQLYDEIFTVKLSLGEPGLAFTDFAHRCLEGLLSDTIVAGYRLIIAEAGRFPEMGRTTYELAVRRGVERLAHYFADAMAHGTLRLCDPIEAAESFLDLAAGSLHTQRLWNAIAKVEEAALQREARRISTVFLAAYGNEELSRAARASD
ncbi:MAG: TetR/AcrR family transcriptional regulator [Rhizomicrobium sp.]|nr:TetR/AcrR family transcriptional regulator [Rhizomicrobium sp.]